MPIYIEKRKKFNNNFFNFHFLLKVAKKISGQGFACGPFRFKQIRLLT